MARRKQKLRRQSRSIRVSVVYSGRSESLEIAELSDIQAESGVIGTLLYHPEFIFHSNDYLQPGQFSETTNGCIYWAILELYKQGIDKIDAYNLSNMLKSNPGVAKTIEKYNLPKMQELIDLYSEVARNSEDEYKMLAKKVTSLAFKRKLVQTMRRTELMCMDKDISLDVLSNKVYDALNRVTENFVASEEIKTFGESADVLWNEIVDRRTENGLYGLPSKFESVNEYFTYEAGEAICILGGFKQGKSTFVLNETVHKLRMGVPTVMFDTEMQDRLFMERFISHISGVELKKIKTGQYSDGDAKVIAAALTWIKSQPFVHIYDPDMTEEQMLTTCKILQYKMGLQFVVYDYIKSNEADSASNYNLIGAKCDFLKNKIAGGLNVAVLTAAQLNRHGEVADSDKINRYMSVCAKWFLKSGTQIEKDGEQCGNAGLIIYANRLGIQMPNDGDVYLDFVFDGSTARIEEAQEQHTITENPFE